MRRRTRYAALLLLLGLIDPLVAGARTGTGTGTEEAARPRLPTSPAEAVSVDISLPAPTDVLAALRPPASGIRVALLSSGVDRSALDAADRNHVHGVGSDADGVGYGTYAASVVLGMADAEILSLDVFGGQSRTNPGRLVGALGWARDNASKIDAVLVAVPPHEVLDPVSEAMDAGTWNEILAAGADHPVRDAERSLFGVAFGEAGRAQRASMPPDRRRAVESFVASTERWYQLSETVRALAEAGVGVVVPAGDTGPAVQSLLGLANLPRVIAVGGFDGRGPSRRSASGPSVDGRVKPDLLVATGIPGRIPPSSALGAGLGSALADLLPIGVDAPASGAIRLDTTFTSAAVAAAAMGSLGRQGLRDIPKQRGALVAASVPLPGVPVWRQGAGVLRFAPDASLERSRPLALAHGDLQAEPDGGTWKVTVPFSARTEGSPSVTLTDFAGVGPDGRTYIRGTQGAPPVSVKVTRRGVELTAPVGEDRFEGGLYCGYATVPVPTTGSGIEPRLVWQGAPGGVEQVPTCLVEGTRLRSFGFYIHDLPASDLTFALLPALPEEASIVERPLQMLPVDPFHTKLFVKVTDKDGFADFPNVPPGNFLVRLFSDYGSPVTQTFTDAKTGAPIEVRSDIGENPSYSNFEALVLSAVGWTEQNLRERFGDRNVTPDAPTGTYWVKVGDRRVRVALGFLKDKPGTAVSSRYIDLLSYGDLDFDSVIGPLDSERIAELPRVKAKSPWAFGPAPGDPDATLAAFNPAALARGEVLGIARYPFNLTTPNYKAHMSLNFSYDLKNALIGVVVVMGGDSASGMVTPEVSGRVANLEVLGPTSGLANFEFSMLPRGAREGTLYLVFLPSPAVARTAPSLATATVDDLSFSLDTWQRVPWPAQMNEDYGMGHVFGFEPNYSERQMSDPGCRRISSGGVAANVCEDWTVLVHSPGDDAATVDILDKAGRFGPELSAGALYADPRRGIADFSSELAFVLPETGVPASLALELPTPVRTNGRFWEQLAFSRDLLRRHPGTLQVLIVDNARGRSSALAPRVRGGMPVAPYVPFAAGAGASSLLDPPALILPLPL